MNKKGFGFVSNFVFGFIGLLILLLILASLIGMDNENLNKELVIQTIDNSSSNALLNFQINESNGPVINVLYSACSFIIYSSFEVAKAGISYGVEHPEVINPKTLLIIIIISLSLPIIWYAFLIFTSIFLIIKEAYLNRKHKNFLEKTNAK